MDINLLKQMKEIISKLPKEQQAEEYEKLVGTIISSMEEKKKVGRPKKDKVITTTKKTTEKKEKKQPDPEVTECMEIVKNYNGGMIEGAEGNQRKYAKLLIDKMKKIDSIQTGKTTRQEVLNIILNIVSNNKYHATKIASPEKIYYNLTTLMQVCKQEGKQQTFDVNAYTLPGING